MCDVRFSNLLLVLACVCNSVWYVFVYSLSLMFLDLRTTVVWYCCVSEINYRYINPTESVQLAIILTATVQQSTIDGTVLQTAVVWNFWIWMQLELESLSLLPTILTYWATYVAKGHRGTTPKLPSCRHPTNSCDKFLRIIYPRMSVTLKMILEHHYWWRRHSCDCKHFFCFSKECYINLLFRLCL